MLRVGNTAPYAYGTNTEIADIPTLHSTDLVHWKVGKDAMPAPAPWVQSDIWAPVVYRGANGKYELYFAARYAKVNHRMHRVRDQFLTDRAVHQPRHQTADLPGGTWGSIDPDVFRDGKGSTYVLWKNDGNCCGFATWLWAQRANANATKLVGKPVKLDYEQQAWEGILIEAPFMWKHGGKYFLFFSANDYASYDYAVGYATCNSPMGPCADAKNNPILKTNCGAVGPGGETIITDARGQTWMLYHAWAPSAVGDNSVGRRLWIDKLNWKNGKPVVHGPTCTSQPAPST